MLRHLILVAGVLVGLSCGVEPLAVSPDETTATTRGALSSATPTLLADLSRTSASWSQEFSGGIVGPGGDAYFFANHPMVGQELWRTDGTAEGTRLVVDAMPGTLSTNGGLMSVGSHLVFIGMNLGTGKEPWLSDGTSEGTRTIADLVPGIESPIIRDFGAIPGASWAGLFTQPFGGAPALWLVDEPHERMRLLREFTYFIASSAIGAPGRLYFIADDQLWVSDGTPEGTRGLLPWTTRLLTRPAMVNDRLIIITDAGGPALWTSDGTLPGTRQIFVLGAVPLDSQTAVLDGSFLFRNTTADSGSELWVSDGTTGGTHLLLDLEPGPGSSSPAQFTRSGDRVFFSATVAGQSELCVTDGTAPGTRCVRAATDGTRPLAPDRLTPTATAGRIAFRGPAQRPFVSDGTPEGTRMLVDMEWSGGGILETHGRIVFSGVTAGQRRFVSYDPDTDTLVPLLSNLPERTANSTLERRVDLPGRTILSGNGRMLAFDGLHPSGLVDTGLPVASAPLAILGSRAIVASYPNFLVTDWTAAGTPTLCGLSSSPSLVVRVGNEALVPCNGGWLLTDGLTSRPVTFSAGAGNERSLRSDGHKAYVLGGSGSPQPVMLLEEGSTTFRRIGTVPYQGGNLEAFAGGYVFVGRETQGDEPWLIDASGTVRLLADINPGASSSKPQLFQAFGSLVVFVANDGTHGEEPWISDGTPGGTRLLADVNPGPEGSATSDFMIHDGLLYFAANDALHGRELWSSDGTPEGTALLVDIWPGHHSSTPALQRSLPGGPLIFAASDGATGFELWRTYGTARSTKRLTDLAPGQMPSNPVLLGSVGSKLVIAADDGRSGNEPWALDFAPPRLGCRDVRNDILLDERPVLSASLVEPSGGSPPYTVRLEPPEGTPLPFGPLSVAASMEDEEGLIRRCTFTVETHPRPPPRLRCPSRQVLEATTPAGAHIVPEIDASDDWRDVEVAVEPSIEEPWPLGTRRIDVTATTADGRRSTCAFDVEVRDTTAPTLTCPASVSARADGPDGAFVRLDEVRATDLVSTVAPTFDRDVGDRFPIGVTRVKATARDAAGNTSTCLFDVSVVDEQPPVLQCPERLVLEADDSSGAPIPVLELQHWATDAEGIVVVESPSRAPLGSSEITVIARDASSNEARCAVVVDVLDTRPPRLSCPGPIQLEASDTALVPAIYPAVDANDEVSSVSLSWEPVERTLLAPGAHDALLRVRDDAGNEARCAVPLIVRDVRAPTIHCPESNVVEATSADGARVSFEVTATDPQSETEVEVTIPSGSILPLGETRIDARARDEAGNEATCAFVVRVQDSKPPKLTCHDTVRLEATSAQGALLDGLDILAVDTVSATTLTTQPPTAQWMVLGAHDVQVTASDATGNASTCVIRVVVADTTPPTLTCGDALRLEATSRRGALLDGLEIHSTDAVSTTTITSQPAAAQWLRLGTHDVQVTARDVAGNTSTCVIPVEVADATPPIIECPPSRTIEATSAIGTPTSRDLAEGSDTTGDVVITDDAPGLFPLGTTTVTARAVDESGNVAHCTYELTVADTTPPRLLCPPSQFLQDPEAGVVDLVPTVEDVLPVHVTSSVADDRRFDEGRHEITLRAVDDAGNASECSFTVTVAPAPVAPGGCNMTGGTSIAALSGIALLARRRRRVSGPTRVDRT